MQEKTPSPLRSRRTPERGIEVAGGDKGALCMCCRYVPEGKKERAPYLSILIPQCHHLRARCGNLSVCIHHQACKAEQQYLATGSGRRGSDAGCFCGTTINGGVPDLQMRREGEPGEGRLPCRVFLPFPLLVSLFPLLFSTRTEPVCREGSRALSISIACASASASVVPSARPSRLAG